MCMVMTVITFAIRQYAAWASTLTTHKHSPQEKKKTNGKPKQKKEACAQKSDPFCTQLQA